MEDIKLVDVEAYTKQEAIEKAKEAGFDIPVKYNATIAYREATEQPAESFDPIAFAQDQIEKKARGAAGVGFMIVLEAGKPETKTRLYSVENVPTEGPRHYLLTYEVGVQDGDTFKVYSAHETKADALAEAKILVNKEKVSMIVRMVKYPETNGIAAKVNYSPSEDLKLGVYRFFGKA